MPAPSASRRGGGARTGSTSGANLEKVGGARAGGGRGAGATRGAHVEVVGLKELRRELSKLENPRYWTTRLGRAQREIAQKVAGWSRFAASGMGGPQKHFANAIKGRGGVTGSKIIIANEDANMAFWGGKQRSGWFGSGRFNDYDGGGYQHPRWVGNSWDVGVAGQGPYAINDTIARRTEQIIEMYGDGVDEITADAFPN